MRIIAGSLRGRRLGPPPPGVRPTADRVRESLFGRLGDVSGARVLDLFAGTGALGIEAISRGAESVVFVDLSARTLAVLERSLDRLGIAEHATLMKCEARGALRRLAGSSARFDLVFVDPPYDDFDAIGPLLEQLVADGLLVPGATVVVECAKRHAVPPTPGLEVEAIRAYGDTSLTWLVGSAVTESAGGARAR